MAKKLKDPFGCTFANGYTIEEAPAVEAGTAPAPAPERAAPVAVPPVVGAHVPTLTPKGQAWLANYWQFKTTAKCPRCGERRFQNLYDVGAGYGPPGCQIGICAPCGADLKLSRPRRKRLATWEGA